MREKDREVPLFGQVSIYAAYQNIHDNKQLPSAKLKKTSLIAINCMATLKILFRIKF